MNEAVKPYPNYRPSGVKWFDRVPTHWEVRRLRNVADLRVSSVDKHKREDEENVRLCNYVDVYNNDRITAKMNFMHATATPDEIERYRLERGDVLVTKDSETWDDIGVPALVSDSAPDLISGYHLALLRPRSEYAVGGYLFRALESKGISRQFHVQARGVTRFGLTHVGIESARLPVPPLPEQVGIARFLDHADRRIQRYIRAKQKLLALLDEQKQAIIHQAVTGQIDVRTGEPYSAYKPSGVEWLGDVPDPWDVVPLRRVTLGCCDGPFGSGLKSSHYTEKGVRVVRLQNIGHGEFKDSDVAFISPEHYSSLGDHSVVAGDVLIAGLGDKNHPSGRACVAPAGIIPAMVKADCFRFRLNQDQIQPRFAALQLTATAPVASAVLSTGATRQRTNLQATSGRAVGVPSVPEQHSVVEYLTAAVCDIRRVRVAVQQEIDLLREYRTA